MSSKKDHRTNPSPKTTREYSIGDVVILMQGNLNERGRLSIVNLFVLTSLEHLLLTLKTLLTFSKTSYLKEEVNCTEPSL